MQEKILVRKLVSELFAVPCKHLISRLDTNRAVPFCLVHHIYFQSLPIAGDKSLTIAPH